MFSLSKEELQRQGAENTTREIYQQPELWHETFTNYQKHAEKLRQLLADAKQQAGDRPIRVIFTGAGTSQYVGDTVVPFLNYHGDTKQFIFQSIGSTDIVATPREYLIPEETTILVSFARSGNSPESLAAVEIVNQLVDNIYHIVITCAPDGLLATQLSEKKENLVLLMPNKANDAGFAMTSSFSCMTLTALLIFDQTSCLQKEEYVNQLSKLGKEIIQRESEILEFLKSDFHRIIYLGSGSLAGLTREAQLKVLELTAGKIATVFDSSLGFRHGPKSFVDEQTLVFLFVSNDSYTQKYDVDMLEEIKKDGIALRVVGIGQKANLFSGDSFEMVADSLLPDGYLALADIVVAQTIALLCSVKVGNTPDTPSPSGTVNRVVKGVTIYPYEK
jgi:tagatose-6-phosphate ketose/aldose isomerase